MSRWHSDEVHPASLLERLRHIHAHRLSPEQASRLAPWQREILKGDVMRVFNIAGVLERIGKIDMDGSATGRRRPACYACGQIVPPAPDSPNRMLSDLRRALEC